MSPDTKMTCGIICAGHTHAGVLVILSLIAKVLADYTSLNQVLEKFIRVGFPLAAILVSSGFFLFILSQAAQSAYDNSPPGHEYPVSSVSLKHGSPDASVWRKAYYPDGLNKSCHRNPL
jgi:uncharacterized membrane protein YcfT